MSKNVDLFGNEVPEVPSERRYDAGDGKTIGRSSLRDAEEETQIAAMKNWFYANYEHPEENTPYIGSEGGYQFIHGGPFEAREVLEEEFSEVVPECVLEAVIEGLDDAEWAPKIEFDYDQYLLDSIIQYTQHYQDFAEAMSNTRYLAGLQIPSPQDQHFYRILFVSIINALEAYLSDNFISNVCGEKGHLRTFVETDELFSKREILIKEMFKRADGIQEEVKAHLLKLSWHRISHSRRMFRNTLHVLFPDDIKDVEAAVRVRHDIVHRGGKKKDGSHHQITKSDIDKTARAAEELVWFIEHQMNPEAVRLPEGADEHSAF
jgi:hypothetical protein